MVNENGQYMDIKLKRLSYIILLLMSVALDLLRIHSEFRTQPPRHTYLNVVKTQGGIDQNKLITHKLVNESLMISSNNNNNNKQSYPWYSCHV